jgi:16S rRNA (cytosine967-C5)-methyltransferase
MSRWYSYLNSAMEILEGYYGEEPLASFLKKFFSQHKKYGSTDRKWVSHLCYCYFRPGKAWPDLPTQERIIAALFLCSKEPGELLEQLRPEWNSKTSLSLPEKSLLINNGFDLNAVFPWKNELSPGIEFEKFNALFFTQPDLFLRVRPGKEKIVKENLEKAGIDFEIISDNCLALPNNSKADAVIEMDKDAVVQDFSSQGVRPLLIAARPGYQERPDHSPPRVWDCCAGSGGKSIMVVDLLGKIELTVSDSRESILSNLKKRFASAGIKKYKAFETDLTKPVSTNTGSFDLIMADVPCTGSGTWSRTPEQLYFFDVKRIEEYVLLQRKIISNAITHLVPGGQFLYITCSVFEKENEEQADFIKEKFNLEIIRMEILKGYDKKADTMFAALLQKPL